MTTMTTKTTLATLVAFLSASMMVSAYHIDYDGNDYGDGPLIADEWVNPAEEGKLVTVCESTGSDDKINPFIDPLLGVGAQLRGEGGLCYASSQDFADCEVDPGSMVPYTLKTGPDSICDHDKADWKDKKPNQSDDTADWGFIQPKCNGTIDPLVPADCDPEGDQFVPGDNMEAKPSNGDLPGTNPLNPLGLAFGDWTARIGANSRSCTGSWGQAFAYKEIVAYFAGAGTNSNETAEGVSGHVTFFVSEENVAGGYDRLKLNIANPIQTSPANMAKSFAGVAPNCTGDGNNWGLDDDGIPKTILP